MHSSKNSMINFLLLVLSFLSLTCHGADPTYVYHICSNTTTFAINSTYQTNLNTLLSSLPSNASRTNAFSSGFYSTTAGQDPDDVYGHFLCRGDASSSTCQDCVNFATRDVIRRCPVEKVAIIWYDECLLRYSNASLFSILAEAPTVTLYNFQNSTDPSRFNDEVGELMNETATRALDSPRKFATRNNNISLFQTLYSLVQCTPDLSNSDCNRCLRGGIARLPSCCSGSIGGQVLKPSCFVRYEVYPFYNESLTAAPPPLLPSLPPSFSFPPPTGPQERSRIRPSTIVAIVVPVSFSVVLFIACCFFLSRRARKKNKFISDGNAEDDITTVESLQFDFGTIEAATNQFSTDDKLGEGGFGQVYKGVLPNGQKIAVKRLSRNSGQGAEEFKNEVVLVAKLQHRNLVKLLGFCLEGEEKILVYEFVANKSLDYFLYDPEKQKQLNWSRCYKIIEGIARGILYLHVDSRLRIIHRDLKVSNILLDDDMNPKISDFGMARIFGADQTQGNTSRVVGTYGYMAPEYAMRGYFSVKSDVYSFGVLILEIITGKKSSSFYETDGATDLLSYAWKHWRDGTPLELLDPTLLDSYSRNEVVRCIQAGLLCVQEDPAARPTMATILLMLNSYSVTLPVPQEPAFFYCSGRSELSMPSEMKFDQSTSKLMTWSVDAESITEVYPR